jgi:hypothetical protein
LSNELGRAAVNFVAASKKRNKRFKLDNGSEWMVVAKALSNELGWAAESGYGLLILFL